MASTQRKRGTKRPLTTDPTSADTAPSSKQKVPKIAQTVDTSSSSNMPQPQKYLSTNGIVTNEKLEYFVLTPADVRKDMQKCMEQANEYLQLPETHLRHLLTHCHWNVSFLTEKYFEQQEKMFRQAGIANPRQSPSLPEEAPLSPPSFPIGTFPKHNVQCKTCFADKPITDLFALQCLHYHCHMCWVMYLFHKITSARTSKITCISRCDHVVEDEQVLLMLDDNQEAKDKYHQLIIESFVESNRLMRWCPSPDCHAVIKMKSYQTGECCQEITCDQCKNSFCYQCSAPWHEPLQCELLRQWIKKNEDDSMTGTWVMANTKNCPKCHTSIEKNGGCNHMTCRQKSCNHEFCWLCFGNWKDHGMNGHQCNVYKESEAEKKADEARSDLHRYMHYYTRYEAHDQSLKLEGKLQGQLADRLAEMEANYISFTTREALKHAYSVLRDCRRTLKYTYPFAFYLYRNNQAEVFETNQANLEHATEVLSGYMEKEFGEEQKSDEQWATTMMNHYRFCDRRRQILLAHCKEGYAQHYWGGLKPYVTDADT